MCLLSFPSPCACLQLPLCTLLPAPSLRVFFLINQSDIFVAEMVTSESPAGLYFSFWAKKDPTACGRTSVCPVADNGFPLDGRELGLLS